MYLLNALKSEKQIICKELFFLSISKPLPEEAVLKKQPKSLL